MAKQLLDERTKRTRKLQRELAKLYPDARCALDFGNPLQLLIATILSAQCTDKRVNMVTPSLFARYTTAEAFAEADLSELETLIQTTGFFRNKAKSIKACCQRIVSEYDSEVPRTMEELLTLPGVARKTANVVLGNAFDVPGITVDTHLGRLARRMGMTEQMDPVKVERELAEQLPSKVWTDFSHQMITHGRQVCAARKPACDRCEVVKLCPRVGVEEQPNVSTARDAAPKRVAKRVAKRKGSR